MTADLIEIPTGELSIPAVEAAARVLDDGGLVVIPTDTVYGLCCRAGRPEAVRRVFEAKQRPEDKPLPFLIPDADAVQTFVNHVPPAAQRLMDLHWPGALTLVLGPNEGVALRVPDHAFARAVLRATGGPVHGTSANLSGDSDTTSGRAAHAALGETVDLVFDGGETPGSGASTIVRVPDEGPIAVLREGGIPRKRLVAEARFTVALVCTGNTCRSPMAAALLRHLLAQRLSTTVEGLPEAGVDVVSAGVMAWEGSPMTPEAAEALEAAGVLVPEHASQRWTAELASQVDRALVMTPSHLERVHSLTPEAAHRAAVLDPSGQGVADPIGGDLAVYQGCLDQMGRLLEGWLDRWVPRAPS